MSRQSHSAALLLKVTAKNRATFFVDYQFCGDVFSIFLLTFDWLDKSWEIKASELQLLEELGSGQFGVVRHGKWMGKIDVAVKLMKEGTMSEHDFIEEAKVMTKLQHKNLVKLYGLCIEHRPICIVAEFMKHGTLKPN